MLTCAKHIVTFHDNGAINEEHGSDWSHQVSVVATTRWLQHDQTLPFSAKGVACETRRIDGTPKDRKVTNCLWHCPQLFVSIKLIYSING